MHRFARVAAALGVCALVSSYALGQSYPAGPVRLIVPFPPGGTADPVACAVAQKLSQQQACPGASSKRRTASWRRR